MTSPPRSSRSSFQDFSGDIENRNLLTPHVSLPSFLFHVNLAPKTPISAKKNHEILQTSFIFIDPINSMRINSRYFYSALDLRRHTLWRVLF